MSLSWKYEDLEKWINEGCDNDIALSVMILVINHKNITLLPKEIGFLINLSEFSCCDNKLTEFIPEIGNLINLKIFNCGDNELTEMIPQIGNLINLEYFSFSGNNIKELIPEIGNLVNLISFKFCRNKITELIPQIGNLINLCYFYFNDNELSELIPEIGNLINLNHLSCSGNKLKELIPEIGNLINLEYFSCCDNKLTELVPEIGNLVNLNSFYYSNNPIEYINPQILRYLNRRRNIQKIYNDDQSVHNHQIQEGISNSIKYIMSIKPIKTKDELNDLIFNNPVLTHETKSILIEYCDNTDIHSVLNITFEELLLNIYSLILINENKDEIFKIMNIEMNDSLCKCFTGRISRLVNCLNGFDSNIKINISDNEQIGNIIILIKGQLITENKYNLETHKNLVKINLLEKGYELNIIEGWLGYFE